MAENEIALNEAQGTLVSVDRTLFMEMVKYLKDNDLIDQFNEYLEANACYDIILDVNVANHFKKFLVTMRRTDSKAKMAIMCGCGGGGGGPRPTPTGVRG